MSLVSYCKSSLCLRRLRLNDNSHLHLQASYSVCTLCELPKLIFRSVAYGPASYLGRKVGIHQIKNTTLLRPTLISARKTQSQTAQTFPNISPLVAGNQRPSYFLKTKPSFSKAAVINGKAIAQEIQDEIKAEVSVLIAEGKRAPRLSVLLVGNDPASVIYVRNKALAAEYTGISCDILRVPENISEAEILRELDILNKLPEVDGILVQLPLPFGINERTVCDAVLPGKDVDGFNVLNVGRFCVNQKAFIPATPSGVLEILKRLNVNTSGKNAVVCGRSKNVGLPIALHLHASSDGSSCIGDATTTICHRHTPPEQLKHYIKSADILVTATGVPGLVTADMVKEGVVVIDIGITRIIDNHGKARLVGDVDFSGVCKKASFITPVPGGVGPVTVAMVIKNTLTAYKNELDYGPWNKSVLATN
ncbi:putative bifunctional methylenetetrahydrofolate dehydrogenase/cyclohydrolase 2 [Bulinus truncatus]|nr:putative bifunctional methylenetetrahydrofolate dehydrogenase/cyclohydrolase 2 [Bulinus truncatus]